MHNSLKNHQNFIVFLLRSTCFGHSCALHQEPPNSAHTASSHNVSLGWMYLPGLVCHYCLYEDHTPGGTLLYSMSCVQENMLILTLTIGRIIRTCTFSPCELFVIMTQRLFVFVFYQHNGINNIKN
jgi:hypothetical protein